MARANEQERLTLEAARLEREARRLERALAKQGVRGPRLAAETGSGRHGELKLFGEATRPGTEPEPNAPHRRSSTPTPPPPEPKEKKKDKFQPLTPISCENYELPSLDLLDPDRSRTAARPRTRTNCSPIQDTIIETLAQFGIAVTPGDITRGPTITRYEVYPANGVRVDKIVEPRARHRPRHPRRAHQHPRADSRQGHRRHRDRQLARSRRSRCASCSRATTSSNAKAKIPIALGKDVYGNTIIADLAAMPHGLVAGTTGSGKSVCINAIIASILYRFTPEDLRFIMIDPKVVEMQIYNTLPHLVVPVVTDPKKVLLALRWAVNEMEKRYAIFAKVGVRNIGGFNARPQPKIAGANSTPSEAAAPSPRDSPRPTIPTEPRAAGTRKPKPLGARADATSTRCRRRANSSND